MKYNSDTIGIWIRLWTPKFATYHSLTGNLLDIFVKDFEDDLLSYIMCL